MAYRDNKHKKPHLDRGIKTFSALHHTFRTHLLGRTTKNFSSNPR